MKRILIALLCIFAVLLIASLILQGNPWLLLMVLLGGTIGIPMGLSFPFPVITKVAIITGLLASVISVIFGFKNHKRIIGQIFAVIGILGWFFIGLMGLGTGT